MDKYEIDSIEYEKIENECVKYLKELHDNLSHPVISNGIIDKRIICMFYKMLHDMSDMSNITGKLPSNFIAYNYGNEELIKMERDV